MKVFRTLLIAFLTFLFSQAAHAQTCAAPAGSTATGSLYEWGDESYLEFPGATLLPFPHVQLMASPPLYGALRGPAGSEPSPGQIQTLQNALTALQTPLEKWGAEFPTAFSGNSQFLTIVADIGMMAGDGSFVFAFVPDFSIGDSGVAQCRIFIDYNLTNPETGSTSESASSDGVPLAGPNETTVAHESFHCVQLFLHSPAGGVLALPSSELFLWEGSARWSEHLAYPARQSEWTGAFGIRGWVSEPETPFFDRSESAVFAYMYADVVLGMSALVKQTIVQGAALNDAKAAFETVFFPGIGGAAVWHEISVAGWNREPVEVFTEGSAGVSDPPCFETEHLAEYEEKEISLNLASYSHANRKIHLTPGPNGMPIRVGLDLSEIVAAQEGHATLLVQTTDGWMEPQLVTGKSDVEVCAEKKGPCAWPTLGVHQIHAGDELQSVTLIVTNGHANPLNDLKIRVNTHNPVLTGSWERTSSVVRAGTNNGPFQIVGTGLSFDEPEKDMGEATGAFSLLGSDLSRWDCAFAGAYTIGIEADYDRDAMEGGNGPGVVTIQPARRSTQSPWNSTCKFTGDGAAMPIKASNIHIPVAAIPPPHRMLFELTDDGQSLTVWPGTPSPAVKRIYKYRRLN